MADMTGRGAGHATGAGSGSVTIYEVAREAGVSTATVSRVINGRRHVRETTRIKVEEAMNRLGYVANRQARGLAGGRSRMIGLLVHELGSSYFSQVIRGIDIAAAAIGFDLMLYTSHARVEAEMSHALELATSPVDGVIFVLAVDPREYVETLRQRGMPFVLLDHSHGLTDITSVAAANQSGTAEAIEHLVDLGHRRIGFISGKPGVGSARERLAGYRDALAGAGIPYDRELAVTGDFLEKRGYEATKQLLALDDRPTAVFTSADTAAFGAIKAARDAGLRVPQDLSVVGFDDIPEASLVMPPLTTVRQPLMEMGTTAVRLLQRLMEEPGAAPCRTELDTELVVRGSTAPPPRGRMSL